MEHLLAIDLSGNLLTAVMVEKESGITLVKNWAILQLESELPSQHELNTIVSQTGFREGKFFLSIDCSNCSFRNLSLPFTNRKQLAQVLPFELENLFTIDSKELHMDFLNRGDTDGTSKILAATVKKNLIEQLVLSTEETGLNMDFLTLAGMTYSELLGGVNDSGSWSVILDIGFPNTTCTIVDGTDIQFIRSIKTDPTKQAGFYFSLQDSVISVQRPENLPKVFEKLAAEIRKTVFSASVSFEKLQDHHCYLSGSIGLKHELAPIISDTLPFQTTLLDPLNTPLVKLDANGIVWKNSIMSRSLSLALLDDPKNKMINFRKGVFQKKQPILNRKKILLFAVSPVLFFLSLMTFYCWFDYNSLSTQHNELEEEIYQVFEQTLPQATTNNNPIKQLEAAINDLDHHSGSFQPYLLNQRKVNLLRTITEKTPRSIPVHVARVIIDESKVTLAGNTDNYNNIDTLKRSYSSLDMFKTVAISSANLEQNSKRIRFEIQMEFNQ